MPAAETAPETAPDTAARFTGLAQLRAQPSLAASVLRFFAGRALKGIRLRALSAVLGMGTLGWGLVGCDGTSSEARGVVTGMVTAEGTPLAQVVVEISGPQTRVASTDEVGRYRFEEVPVGAYVVSVRELPFDVTFPAVSRPAIVSAGSTVSVDFAGNVIRTAAITGVVRSGDQGVSGVTVVLGGPSAASVQTDSAGAFQFAALRSGTYTIEISGFAPSLQFPVTRSTVILASGQTGSVSFQGTRQLTASAVIRSLLSVGPGGVREPADPQSIRGRIEVLVTLDRGQDTPDSIVMLLGETVVGVQRFVPARIGASDPLSEGALLSQASAPVELAFSIETGAFDEGTGVPRFRNGEETLSVRLATREGGSRAWTASRPLTLANRDTFVARLTPARGPVTDEQGATWIGGALDVRVVPVVFTPGRVVTSVVLELRRTGGPGVARASALGEGPFTVRFLEEGGGEASLAGYATPAGAADEIRVVQAGYGDGTPFSAVPLTIATGLRLDLSPPSIERFQLPTQLGSARCCLENWVGSSFQFSDALGTLSDLGAGGATVRFHAGSAILTDAQLRLITTVTSGADLQATVGNTALRAIAVAEDRLGNRRILRFAPGPGNPLTAPDGGAVFGVDLTRPVATLAPGGASLPARSVNPSDGSLWVLAVTETGVSGLPATLPVRVTIRRDGPGDPPGGACVFPAADPSCTPIPDALLRPVPTLGSGYFTYRATVVNRAGNPSLPIEARVLRDITAPTVASLSASPVRVGGQDVVLGGDARDDVDLFLARFRFGFGADALAPELLLPLLPVDTLGTPFGMARIESAVFQTRAPFVRGVQRAESGPSGDAAGGGVLPTLLAEVELFDGARNQATRRTALTATGGGAPRGFDVSALAGAAVQGWRVSASGPAVCRDPLGCALGAPGVIRFTAEARGVAGTFNEPFRWVHFIAEGPNGAIRLGQTEGGTSATVPGPSAEGARWRWTFDWTPGSEFPAGPVVIRAVGVDMLGNALLSPPLGTLTVEGAGS